MAITDAERLALNEMFRSIKDSQSNRWFPYVAVGDLLKSISESSGTFVDQTGDTMTGPLVVPRLTVSGVFETSLDEDENIGWGAPYFQGRSGANGDIVMFPGSQDGAFYLYSYDYETGLEMDDDSLALFTGSAGISASGTQVLNGVTGWTRLGDPTTARTLGLTSSPGIFPESVDQSPSAYIFSWFQATGDVSKGDVVIFDSAAAITVIRAPAGDVTSPIVGVSVDAVTGGGTIRVITFGYALVNNGGPAHWADGVNTDNVIGSQPAAYVPLGLSASTAGNVAPATNGGTIVGYKIPGSSAFSSRVAVFVNPGWYFSTEADNTFSGEQTFSDTTYASEISGIPAGPGTLYSAPDGPVFEVSADDDENIGWGEPYIQGKSGANGDFVAFPGTAAGSFYLYTYEYDSGIEITPTGNAGFYGVYGSFYALAAGPKIQAEPGGWLSSNRQDSPAENLELAEFNASDETFVRLKMLINENGDKVGGIQFNYNSGAGAPYAYIGSGLAADGLGMNAMTFRHLYGGGGGSFLWTNTASQVLAKMVRDNGFQVQAGGATTALATVGGVIHINSTAVGNVGADEDTLMTYTMPANVLNVTGRTLRIKAWGRVADVANTKTLKLHFGSAVILTQIADATSGANTWEIVADVVRTGTDAQDYNAKFTGNVGAAAVYVYDQEIGTATQDDGAAITIKVTGEGTSNDDIVQEGMTIEVQN